MGNCECVTTKQTSFNPDMPQSPARSRQEDEHLEERATEERQSINAMRSFHCRSLSTIKMNNLACPSDHKSKVSSFAPKAISPTKADTEAIVRNDLSRLKSMKIDPTIFINMKKGKVTENYQIESLLGEGTYGKVLLVTHKKTNLKRALKSRSC